MREEKQLLLDEIKEKIEESNGFIIARYQNLTAARSRQFRDAIANAGGEFEVVGKRVFIKAAENQGIKLDVKNFQGHVGVIFTQQDVTQLAKLAISYGEQNDSAIALLGARIDREICSAEEIEAIAKLPSLLELRAQIVGMLEGPMAQTIGVMRAALTSSLYCLEEKSKKEEN